MKSKVRALAALLVLMVCWVVTTGQGMSSGAGNVKDFVLFNGSTIDSLRKSSKWIPVKNASRIVIRTWTTHAAFTGPGAGDVDSTTSDSITVWETLLSDSVSFIARDSLGTVVTSRSTVPTTSVHGEPYPICVDSIMFTNGVRDTSKAFLTIQSIPINKALGVAVGGGRLSYIHNITPGTNSLSTDQVGGIMCGDCTLTKNYMKVTVTPLRRSTSQTVLATVPSRVNGLKGLRMVATVYYRNH